MYVQSVLRQARSKTAPPPAQSGLQCQEAPRLGDAVDERTCKRCGAPTKHADWPECVSYLRDVVAELSSMPLRRR